MNFLKSSELFKCNLKKRLEDWFRCNSAVYRYILIYFIVLKMDYFDLVSFVCEDSIDAMCNEEMENNEASHEAILVI